MVEIITNVEFKVKITTNKNTYEDKTDNLGDFNEIVEEIYESINS